MSLSSVRPYLRTVLDELGYDEWRDGFNFENIPSTIFDESYHVEAGTVTGSVANQRSYRYTYPATVRVFLKGFRNPSEAIDDALLRSDAILAGVLAESSRLGGDAIKNVSPGSILVTPFDTSNDNAVILEVEFIFDLIQCY